MKKKKQRRDGNKGKNGIYKNRLHYCCYRKEKEKLKSKIAAELPFLSKAHCESLVINYHLQVLVVMVFGRLLRARVGRWGKRDKGRKKKRRERDVSFAVRM